MYKVWDLEDVREVLDEISKKMGVDCSDIPVLINSRFKRTKGRCTTNKKKIDGKLKVVGVKIEIAECLLNGSYKEEDVRHVIIHEYIHLYTNVTENAYCGHDYRFKQNCVKAGICEDRFVPFKTNKNEYKYTITCNDCNNKFNKHRLNGGVKNYSKYYICAKCNGKLSVMMNY